MYVNVAFTLPTPQRASVVRWASVLVATLIALCVLAGPGMKEAAAAPGVAVSEGAAPIAAAAFPTVERFQLASVGLAAASVRPAQLGALGDLTCLALAAVCRVAESTVGQVAGFVADQAIGLAESAFDLVVGRALEGVNQALATVVGLMATQLFERSTGTGGNSAQARVTDGSFREVYGRTMSIGLVICLPMLLLAIIQALITQKVGQLMRSLLLVLPAAIIGMYAGVWMVSKGIEITDGMADFLAQGATEDINRFTEGLVAFGSAVGFTGAFGPTGVGLGNFVMSAIAMGFVVIASFFIWMTMMVRDMGVLIATLFLPLGLAMGIWPAAMKWTKRLAELLLAFIFAKVLIVGVLALAAALLAGEGSDFESARSEWSSVRNALREANASASPSAACNPVYADCSTTPTVVGGDGALYNAAGATTTVPRGARGVWSTVTADNPEVTQEEGQSITRLILGGMVLFLAAFAPFTVLKMVPIAEAGMAAALEGREKQFTEKAKASGNNLMGKANMALGMAVNGKNLKTDNSKTSNPAPTTAPTPPSGSSTKSSSTNNSLPSGDGGDGGGGGGAAQVPAPTQASAPAPAAPAAVGGTNTTGGSGSRSTRPGGGSSPGGAPPRAVGPSSGKVAPK